MSLFLLCVVFVFFLGLMFNDLYFYVSVFNDPNFYGSAFLWSPFLWVRVFIVPVLMGSRFHVVYDPFLIVNDLKRSVNDKKRIVNDVKTGTH